MRVNIHGITSRQLHTELLAVIRAEYEHNLAQQIYISKDGWEMIKNTRSALINTINTAAKNVEPDSPAINLSKTILEEMIDSEGSPTSAAIDFLKKEISEFF
jgi:hypothetical protein